MTARWPSWRTDLVISLVSFLGGLVLYAAGGWRMFLGASLWSGVPHWVLLVPLAVMAGCCLLRRVAPGTGEAIGLVALAADTLLGGSLGTALIFTQVVYDACVYGRPWLWRANLIGSVAASVLAAAVGVVAAGDWRGVVLGLVVALVAVLPTLTGISVRQYRDQARVQRLRAEQTARLAAWERRQAVADERARMARELHDVVANQLSAIAIHATAVLSAPDPSPQLVRQAVEQIRQSSVSGLAEMRQMIGLLREDGGSDDPATRPGLASLPQLVAQARADGLAVDLHTAGLDRVLPVSVDFAAHRIVRESLTNAWKHGTGAVVLNVDVDGDRVLIETDNALRPDAASTGSGHGLIGMRERAALLDGTLTAGAEDGRWRLRASLPVRHTEEAGV
ncbi:two-component sensor histidine kinase [Catellatospora methionotrophica]|uniref:histidine kinase n=1 Tax=Catellatospora methionotrophica TaxID=121620 RepID=A0A8J3PKR3_9ACTN|nr:histidine kinase [Catellatospora methionotrophica]GIG18731.1 two-component sensor histidine kinase [Catellatospora methionotrophica]